MDCRATQFWRSRPEYTITSLGAERWNLKWYMFYRKIVPPPLKRPLDNVNHNINELISSPDERPSLLKGHNSGAQEGWPHKRSSIVYPNDVQIYKHVDILTNKETNKKLECIFRRFIGNFSFWKFWNSSFLYMYTYMIDTDHKIILIQVNLCQARFNWFCNNKGRPMITWLWI